MSPATSHPGSWRLVVGITCLVACLAMAGVWWFLKHDEAEKPSRPIVLIASGDTAGWIVPCGCTSNQSGGLLRRGTYVSQWSSLGEVVVADVGGAPAGTSAYQRVKFEAILTGEKVMGLAAHNLGGPEAALGGEYLREVSNKLQVPFVSANLRDTQGQLVAEPLRIVEREGRRIALAGVLSQRYAGEGWQIEEPREALLQALAGARGRYDSLVVLAYLPEEELQQLAASLPEADVVLGGPTGQSISPRAIGPILLAAATNKGKFLVHLEVAAGTDRLTWSGRIAEMNGSLADDATQRDNLQRFHEELARRDFPAAETGLASSLPLGLPKEYRIAGSKTCKRCHSDECRVWDESHHSHSWKTLTDKGSHIDPQCQLCHTTGYGLPGGFESVARSSGTLGGVGCESCHGPAYAHTRRPEATRPVFVARDQCSRCHDHENSPTFDYSVYWPKIRHGAATESRSPD